MPTTVIRVITLMAMLLWALPATARSNDAKRGVGVGVGGVGILGIDGRLPLGETFEGELGAFYRPSFTDDYDLVSNIALAAGVYGLWGDARFENGAFAHAATTVASTFSDRVLAAGWTGRLNLGKRQEHAIDFAAGPALIIVVDYPANMTPIGDVVPALYYRATYRRFFD
jgi:hypothetical protein